MNTQETKAQIHINLHQNSINLLIENLAEVLVENEQLKIKIQELTTKDKPKTKT